jgi:hypothetical protein
MSNFNKTINQLIGPNAPVANIVTLLSHYLHRTDKRELYERILGEELRPIIANIKTAYDAADNSHRPQFASIVTDTLTRPLLSELGWDISQQSLASSHRHCSERGPGAKPAKPQLPECRRPLDEAELVVLRAFLDEHSQPASSHTVKVDGVDVPVRYLDRTVAELRKLWCQDSTHRQMVKSTFRKAVRGLKIYKTGRQRGTDLCETCLTGARIESQVRRTLAEHSSECIGRTDVEANIAAYSKISTANRAVIIERTASAAANLVEPIKSNHRAVCSCQRQYPAEFLTQLQSLFFYYHHHALKDESRRSYHDALNNCAANEAILTFDFKENIALNRGPLEGSKAFYDRTMRSVLGCLLVWRDPASKCTKRQYIDSISSCLSHDSLAAFEQIEAIVQRFVKHDLPHVRTIHLWTDTGPHFRSAQSIGSVLFRLPSTTDLQVTQHYFIEGHGKSEVDAHFSLLSAWLREAITQRTIKTTDELMEALTERASAHHTNERVSCSFIKYEPVCNDSEHNHFAGPLGADNGPVPMEIDSDLDRYERVEGRTHCVRPVHEQHSLTLGPHQLYQSYHFIAATATASNHIACPITNDKRRTSKVVVKASLTHSAPSKPIQSKLKSHNVADAAINFAPRLRQSNSLTSYSVRALTVLQNRARAFQEWIGKRKLLE